MPTPSPVTPARPATTASSRAKSPFDGLGIDEALKFTPKYILAQAKQDLFGTKDVQDAITASYVWLADQVGHITLGLIPTMLLCWAFDAAWHCCLLCQLGGVWRPVGMTVIAAAVFAYWVSKERTDYSDCFARRGNQFPFNAADIWWNIKSALFFFALGGIFALAAFNGVLWLLASIALLLWPALRMIFWWLRRKVAFQQGAVPYLFRLADFRTALTQEAIAVCAGIANLKDREITLYAALFGSDPLTLNAPSTRHILVTGPLGAGKTSLAVGIATEFAFGLGIGRYLTAAKLVQSIADTKHVPEQMENDDGRWLWPLRRCDLLIVDDLDAGVSTPGGGAIHFVQPEDFCHAMGTDDAPLAWLGAKRSVWVIGDKSLAAAWIATIAHVMHVGVGDILQIDLSPNPVAP